jgi:hypothetical protein
LLPGANHCTKIFNFFSKYLRITILFGLSKKIKKKKKKFKVPIDKGLIEPSDFMQPFSENRKNKIQVKEIVYSHITDSIESVLSNLFE